MNECICCRDRLLRHLNHHQMYWYCPTCHQPMPNPSLETELAMPKIKPLVPK